MLRVVLSFTAIPAVMLDMHSFGAGAVNGAGKLQ